MKTCHDCRNAKLNRESGGIFTSICGIDNTYLGPANQGIPYQKCHFESCLTCKHSKLDRNEVSVSCTLTNAYVGEVRSFSTFKCEHYTSRKSKCGCVK